MRKFLNNITSLFVGENSRKREIGMLIMCVIWFLYKKEQIDKETFEVFELLATTFTGFAFSWRLKKITKNKEL